jgi:hypothetical protein
MFTPYLGWMVVSVGAACILARFFLGGSSY